MKTLLKYLLAGVLASVLASLTLGAAGCSSPGEKSDDAVKRGLAADSAYLVLIAAQNENAVNYSKAILKTTQSGELKSFAQTVIDERALEAGSIERLQKSVDVNGTPTVAEAAKTMSFTLEELGISAGGEPLAAPSDDAAYVKLMTALDKSAVELSMRENELGGPGTRRFAQEAIVQRNSELEVLEALR